MFNAILLKQDDHGATRAELLQMDDAQLPEGDVTVRVDYSTLNYKDALAITGKGPIVRRWPMVPGIDGAGQVIASAHGSWKPGDSFILNGWGVGESHPGCLAQRARLSGDWLIPPPPGMSARTAMAIGTAGYTAMLSLMALEEQGISKDNGEILVTGASGGVGSIAIALLAQAGYRVTASTGRTSESEYLKMLGASTIIDRAELSAPGKPLQKERWAGVIDTVGSLTLANALAQTHSEGVVTACGLAQGMDLPATVAPFILRGVRLIGINSVTVPLARRQLAWQRLAEAIEPKKLDAVTQEIRLEQVVDKAHELLAGRVRGRVVVNLQA